MASLGNPVKVIRAIGSGSAADTVTGLESELRLCVGARLMLTHNLTVVDLV
jgi:hypothetical protein